MGSFVLILYRAVPRVLSRVIRRDHAAPGAEAASIDAAIATVVERQPSDLLVEGLSPEVRTCDDYRDSRGHLTRQAGAALGRIIATYYAR